MSGARAVRRRAGLPILFSLVAIGFAAASLFHVAALIAPSIAESSPPWRHALFVIVDAAMAFGMLRRGPVFLVAFALFAVQQLCSHGAQAMRSWSQDGRVDPASLVVLVFVPLLAVLLAMEAGRRRAGA